jgi:asparagine synthase (glutamine-hydrolysing)
MRAAVALTARGIQIIAQRVATSRTKRNRSGPWLLVGSDERIGVSEPDGASLSVFDAAGRASFSILSSGPSAVPPTYTGELVVIRRTSPATHALYYWIGSDILEVDHNLERLQITSQDRAALDRSSLLHFLWRGRARPGHTLYRGVRSLGVGEEIAWTPGQRPVVRRYWWPLHGASLSENDVVLAEEALRRIGAAIVRQTSSLLTSGKRVRPTAAILLSGGVDSSLVAALGRQSGLRLTAYTVAFDESYGLNETSFASSVATSLRIPHKIVRVGIKDAERIIRALLASPHPRAAPAAVTHDALVEAVSADGHPRLLSGLGADECFGGYHKILEHVAAQVHHMRTSRTDLAGLLDRPLALLLRTREALFFGVAEFFQLKELSNLSHEPHAVRELGAPDLLFYRGALATKPDVDPLELMAAHEYVYRVSELLLPALRSGINPRSPSVAYPFLDPDVYVWAAALGVARCYWHEGGAWWAKRLLRSAARRLLVNDIVMRKRQVLLAPLAHWLLAPAIRSTVTQELGDSHFWNLQILRKSVRDHALAKLRKYGAPDLDSRWQEQLWALLVVCAWINRHEAAI